MGVLTDEVRCKVFLPNTCESARLLEKEKSKQFAYYTNVDVCFSVLASKQLWLRDLRLMNDQSEFIYAYNNLKKSLFRDKFFFVFEEIMHGLDDDAINFEGSNFLLNYFQSANFERVDSYAICFTEHVDGDGGRLSMWRAYNHGALPIAIIFNVEADSFSSKLQKVNYYGVDQLDDYLNKLLLDIKKNIHHFKDRYLNKNYPAVSLFLADLTFSLEYASHFIKHPGFSEENEWRLLLVQREKSASEVEVKVLNGFPQKIKIQPLSVSYNSSLEKILDHIIIGPCNNPEIAKEAILIKAENEGVILRDDQVRISNVPFRG